MKITVDISEFTELMNDLRETPKSIMKQLYPYYVNKTPIRSGNARNRTKLSKITSTIKSNYGYAGPLDDGRSKQAPKGMTEPTIDYIDDQIEKEVRKIGR